MPRPRSAKTNTRPDERRAGALNNVERTRIEAVAKADGRTARHVERFGVSRDEILSAVRRGWLAQDIAALPASEVAKLAGVPLCPEIAEAIERIRQAPTLPIRQDTLDQHRRRMGATARAKGETGETAMSGAFKRAKDRAA